MKTTLLILAVAGLSGCAVYPVPAYPTYGGGPPMVVEQPVYIEGVYQRRGYSHDYPRGYSRPAPVVVPVPRAVPHGPPRPDRGLGHGHGHGHGDRDHDRDGDRSDRWPNDPRRR